jgi:Uma2 family endonuclease
MRSRASAQRVVSNRPILALMSTARRYIASMLPGALVTADELLNLEMPNRSVELVRGRLMVSEPPGYRHGAVAAEVLFRIMQHVKLQGRGQVFAAETGFHLARDPDTVRAADVAFLSRDRLPDPIPPGYAALGPDLVVEVLSPRDRPGAVLAKVGDWLDAGSRLVWVIDPVRREGRVYRADGSESLVKDDEVLDGEDVLPGFRCVLGEVLR